MAGQADATVNITSFVFVQPFASLTWTVNANAPLCVGVPERTPPADSVRPGGNAPKTTLHVTGAAALLTDSVVSGMAVPAVAAIAGTEIVIAAAQVVVTVSGNVALCVQPFASVAVTVTLNVPTMDGVPKRTPALEKLIPGGSAPEVQVTGCAPPLCVKLTAG